MVQLENMKMITFMILINEKVILACIMALSLVALQTITRNLHDKQIILLHRAPNQLLNSTTTQGAVSREHSVQFLCSQAHIPAGLHPETRLFTSLYVKVKVKVTLRLMVSH
jgi:hypothetical protein